MGVLPDKPRRIQKCDYHWTIELDSLEKAMTLVTLESAEVAGSKYTLSIGWVTRQSVAD